MREISLFIMIIGIIFITVGYMDNKIKEETQKENKIEYRLVPMSIYDEQIKPSNVSDNFLTLFADDDPSKTNYSNINSVY